MALNELSIQVSNESVNKDIKLGLFDASVSDATFKFNLSCTLQEEGFQVSVKELSLTGTVKAFINDIEVLSLEDCELSYDSDNGIWEYPDEIKNLTSLSGATFLNQIDVVLQVIDNAVKQVASKMDVGVLDGAVSDIVAFSEKIKSIFYNSEDLKPSLTKRFKVL